MIKLHETLRTGLVRIIYWGGGGGGGGALRVSPTVSETVQKKIWIFKWQASYLNETEQISVEINTSKCPKIIQLLRVHRYLMIYSIESNGKSLIRRFLILCCINWGIVLTGNALIRRGASCLLNVGRVVSGRVVLFPTKHVSSSSLGFTIKNIPKRANLIVYSISVMTRHDLSRNQVSRICFVSPKKKCFDCKAHSDFSKNCLLS